MQNIKLLIFLIFFSSMQCRTNNDRLLSTLFSNLEKAHNQVFLKEFKETTEKNALEEYFLYFLFKYDELTKKDNDMNVFFQSLNLNDEPSQAYAIILLWHRQLNNKELKISELPQVVNDNKLGVNCCLYSKIINALHNYQKLNVHENIQLKFPVRVSDGNGIKSTVFYGCPILDWDFDISKDLIVNGEIVNKYYKDYYNDHDKDINKEFNKGIPKEFFIQVKIKDINQGDVLYFFRDIQKKDTIEISLNSYGIKI